MDAVWSLVTGKVVSGNALVLLVAAGPGLLLASVLGI
jgi:hypothetical protein